MHPVATSFGAAPRSNGCNAVLPLALKQCCHETGYHDIGPVRALPSRHRAAAAAIALVCLYIILYIPATPENAVFWLGTARRDVRRFPAAARREAGHQLHRVQRGLMPDDWKAMPTVGSGVYEIRIRAAGEHRVCYVAGFADGIYVLHAFEKKTQRTSRADIWLARERLRQLLNWRRLPRHAKESP